MNTFGPEYSEKLDGERLQKQHIAIRNLMLDGQWRTLSEISKALEYPESSVSAQLRHLRKPEFGSYVVSKCRRLSSGTWEYQVKPCVQEPTYQPEMFVIPKVRYH